MDQDHSSKAADHHRQMQAETLARDVAIVAALADASVGVVAERVGLAEATVRAIYYRGAPLSKDGKIIPLLRGRPPVRKDEAE